MKNLLKITFAIILSMAFFSCNSEEAEQDLIIENSTIESLAEEDFKEFALLLSESLNDKAIVNYIYEEASKKFDGDYDILLAKDLSKDDFAKSSSEKVNLKTLLSKKMASKNSHQKVETLDSYFEELLEKYPTLQISVPNIKDD